MIGICVIDLENQVKSASACGHRICQTCCDNFLTWLSSSTSRDGINTGYHTLCPVCLLDQEAHRTLDCVEPKGHTCEVCKELSTETKKCADCHLFLCAPCSLKHTTIPSFKNHTLVPEAEIPVCAKHHEQMVNYKCTECEQFICTICVMLEHFGAGHEIIQLTYPGGDGLERERFGVQLYLDQVVSNLQTLREMKVQTNLKMDESRQVLERALENITDSGVAELTVQIQEKISCSKATRLEDLIDKENSLMYFQKLALKICCTSSQESKSNPNITLAAKTMQIVFKHICRKIRMVAFEKNHKESCVTDENSFDDIPEHSNRPNLSGKRVLTEINHNKENLPTKNVRKISHQRLESSTMYSFENQASRLDTPGRYQQPEISTPKHSTSQKGLLRQFNSVMKGTSISDTTCVSNPGLFSSTPLPLISERKQLKSSNETFWFSDQDDSHSPKKTTKKRLTDNATQTITFNPESSSPEIKTVPKSKMPEKNEKPLTSASPRRKPLSRSVSLPIGPSKISMSHSIRKQTTIDNSSLCQPDTSKPIKPKVRSPSSGGAMLLGVLGLMSRSNKDQDYTKESKRSGGFDNGYYSMYNK